MLVLLFHQALEEAAANAAEEEKKRLLTHAELQDRYRMELEREKTVRFLQLVIPALKLKAIVPFSCSVKCISVKIQMIRENSNAERQINLPQIKGLKNSA